VNLSDGLRNRIHWSAILGSGCPLRGKWKAMCVLATRKDEYGIDSR